MAKYLKILNKLLLTLSLFLLNLILIDKYVKIYNYTLIIKEGYEDNIFDSS